MWGLNTASNAESLACCSAGERPRYAERMLALGRAVIADADLAHHDLLPAVAGGREGDSARRAVERVADALGDVDAPEQPAPRRADHQ